ncbi:MAG: response regulator [Alphaproteobacteria bacterium]|nr:response regulator [Alphaproteobacteria bacterium]
MSGEILVVEDEEDILRLIRVNLEREGYRVRTATTAAAALEVLAQPALPDLVLLDLMLPDLTGTEVCRRIRADERTRGLPVIMVTARSEEIDRVVGLTVGADDYVAKPFSVRELCLRVRAILRRTHQDSPGANVEGLEGLRLDDEGGRVTVGGVERLLTPLESRLLGLLVDNQGRVFTRELLREKIWDEGADVTLQAVDSSVKRLRRKLGPAGQAIETLRGVGYRLSRPA